jgi:hypothetical protein
MNGIADRLLVPGANHSGLNQSPPTGEFVMILWQVNPTNVSGLLVPTTWDASVMTGYAPPFPLNTAQLGFQNTPGTTTAQMAGSVVGAYLNSLDIPSSNSGQKMMITPQYEFPSGGMPAPFADANAVLNGALDLQVPIATGSDTYVNADLLFQGPNGVRLSYGVKLFGNGDMRPTTGTTYDAPSNSYVFDPPLGPGQQFVTMTPGTTPTQSAPWVGWQHFQWSTSEAQFAAMLNYMAAQYPGTIQSKNPQDYLLAEIHLNAEFHYSPSQAELGWSMRGMEIWVN